MKKLDPLHDYYQREIAYLKKSGSLFAEKFPKIARRLHLSSGGSADPHVERLLESFAYLTARLQRDTDDQFPAFTRALLGVLYPQFVNPLPPYTIARFDVTGVDQLTSCYRVPKHTSLFTRSANDQVCRFQTTCDLELAPIKITDATLLPTSSVDFKGTGPNCQRLIKISLECLRGTFQSTELVSLRVWIAGDPLLKRTLYEGIMKPQGEAWALKEGQPLMLGSEAIKPVGFEEGDSMFPYPSQAHPGYGFLLEYFYYPQKFLFIDVNSPVLGQDVSRLDLLLPFADEVRVRAKDVSSSHFLLGCVPVINLFSKISEPLSLDRQRAEYRLVPDLRQELTTEIYDVQEVLARLPGAQETFVFQPYFSYRHQAVNRQDKTFWHMRRGLSNRLEMPGTDIYLSFVDFDFNPLEPMAETIYAKLLCTNRHLAPSIAEGTPLFAQEKLPFSKIYCLERPSAPVYPSSDGAVQWQLISQLSLNHLGLIGDRGLGSLKEFIRLYGSLDQYRVLPEVEMIHSVTTQRVIRRFGLDAWRGFAEGTDIKLTFEETAAADANLFLFATLLNYVLPMFASINSFTQLEIYKTNHEGVWKQWKPRTGSQVLL